MLDARKMQILMAIIDAHILCAEPVGSRTITKLYDLGVSSATIRNEMADLEDMGLLLKPHASSGRIPSDKAYRLYVDRLLDSEIAIDQETVEIVRKALADERKKQGDFLSYAARLLSHLTHYTSVLVLPGASSLTIRHVNLSWIDESELLFTVLSDTGVVKNSIVSHDSHLSYEDILKFQVMLNNILVGKKFSEVDKVLKKASKHLVKYAQLLPKIVPFLMKPESSSAGEVKYSGITNILDYPEYQDFDKAKTLMNFLENRAELLELLSDKKTDEAIKIYIGSENPFEEIQECSIITASYIYEGDAIGKIGIIGPIRMDYSKLLEIFRLFYSTINDGLR